MKRYFGTFGVGQEYAGTFIEIHAQDHHTARFCMMKAHGSRWSLLYDEKEFNGKAKEHDLRRLCVVRQNEPGPHPEEASFKIDRSSLAS
jgi:hypothetical protein